MRPIKIYLIIFWIKSVIFNKICTIECQKSFASSTCKMYSIFQIYSCTDTHFSLLENLTRISIFFIIETNQIISDRIKYSIRNYQLYIYKINKHNYIYHSSHTQHIETHRVETYSIEAIWKKNLKINFFYLVS